MIPGRTTLAARNSSSITSSSSAPASRPRRARPRRRDVPRIDEPRSLFGGRERRDLGEERAQFRAHRFGFSGEVRAERAATAGHGGACRGRVPTIRRSDDLVQRHRPAQVDVRVVLPRESDAAERLDAVLAVHERGFQRERGRRRDRDARAVVFLPHRTRRVPRGGARQLGAREHVGAAMLHALELTDRAAELHAHLRVLGRGVDAPLRDADGFGGEEHRGDLVHARRS